MKISEPQLYKVYYKKEFNKLLPIESDCELVLNRMHVYIIKDDKIYKEVGFKINKLKDGDRYIVPDESDDDYDHFLLCGEKLVMAKRFIVEPNDIIDKIEHNDGGYTFIIEGNE